MNNTVHAYMGIVCGRLHVLYTILCMATLMNGNSSLLLTGMPHLHGVGFHVGPV